MSRPICEDCDKPATHYQKDSVPRMNYCGRDAAKWKKRGIVMCESLYGALVDSGESPAGEIVKVLR